MDIKGFSFILWSDQIWCSRTDVRQLRQSFQSFQSFSFSSSILFLIPINSSRARCGSKPQNSWSIPQIALLVEECRFDCKRKTSWYRAPTEKLVRPLRTLHWQHESSTKDAIFNITDITVNSIHAKKRAWIWTEGAEPKICFLGCGGPLHLSYSETTTEEQELEAVKCKTIIVRLGKRMVVLDMKHFIGCASAENLLRTRARHQIMKPIRN